MRYLIRSLKYFVYYCVFISLILYIMVLAGLAEGNIETMFVNGYKSVMQIALILLVFSAIYPRIGFSKRLCYGQSNVEELKSEIDRIMDGYQYRLLSSEAGQLVYIKRSPILRLLKLYEDKVIISSSLGGVEIDGITKDIVRIKSALEAAQQQTL